MIVFSLVFALGPQLAFGPEPIIPVVPGFSAPFFENLIGTIADLLVGRPRSIIGSRSICL